MPQHCCPCVSMLTLSISYGLSFLFTVYMLIAPLISTLFSQFNSDIYQVSFHVLRSLFTLWLLAQYPSRPRAAPYFPNPLGLYPTYPLQAPSPQFCALITTASYPSSYPAHMNWSAQVKSYTILQDALCKHYGLRMEIVLHPGLEKDLCFEETDQTRSVEHLYLPTNWKPLVPRRLASSAQIPSLSFALTKPRQAWL